MKLKLLCSLVLLAAIAGYLPAQVKVYEGTLTLPYYQEGPPNPNPPFDQYATTRFNYPYVLRDSLTSNRVERNFRAIYLENEYLKCSVLPDVGGHVYTCTDKINNVPMFYQNPSIKEAAIGMRGGWAAFGLEFNFPVSHNWMTVSPVDFAFAKDQDGSASITLSNVDRVYGMQWTVQLVLRPGSTVLEQHVTLNNRSDVRHRFYWWSNAGVEAWDDTRILYPMRYSAAHGFADVDTWPIDSTGTDLSLLKNHTFGPVSRFVHGSREPFMGIWNPKTNAGLAHFADYAELPAKKIWSWGVDADAMDWRKALSDNNSAYVEVQAGLFRNQETYAFLEPTQTIHFTEYWMPLHEIGGLSRANLAGAVNMSRANNNFTVALNVNRRIDAATVRVLDGEKVMQTSTENLAPEHTWTKTLPIADASHHFTFELRDRTGAVLLSQTEGKYDWTPASEIVTGPQPSAITPPIDKRTDGDWLELGNDDELNGRMLIASNVYHDGLKAFPESQALAIAAGRLDAAQLKFDEAIALLARAQSRDTPNAEINYYLGIAYEGLSDDAHARTAFEAASRLPRRHAAAALHLGELAARNGDLVTAEHWLRDALHSTPDDLRTAEELTAVLHAEGNAAAAKALASDWYGRYPTSYFLAEELDTPQIAHLSAEPVRVLNVAGEYMRLGLYEPALKVLSRDYAAADPQAVEPGAVNPSANPLVAYYRAFCLTKLGRAHSTESANASHMPVNYIFPSGQQTYQVLEKVLQENDADPTAHYLMGLLLFSTGIDERAEKQWQRAHELHAVLPGLDADRALARLYIDSDPDGAIAAFKDGIKNDSANDAIYMGMDQALSILGRPASDFIAAMNQYPDKSAIRPKLVYELALHQSEAGNYKAAEDLLRDRFFPREEGGTNVRQVWLEIELQRLQSLANNGQCNASLEGISHLNQPKPGMTFTQDGLDSILASARMQYAIAGLYAVCKQPAEASAIWAKLAASKANEDLVWTAKAAASLPGYDAQLWRKRIAAASEQSAAAAQQNSYRLYNYGMLQLLSGDVANARETFLKVLLLPDQTLSYHLTRAALKTPSLN